MVEQQIDIQVDMPVFQAQHTKVNAYVALQKLPRSFDAMLDRPTKITTNLRKGKLDDAVLERMDRVNNTLANELVKMQIKYGAGTDEVGL